MPTAPTENSSAGMQGFYVFSITEAAGGARMPTAFTICARGTTTRRPRGSYTFLNYVKMLEEKGKKYNSIDDFVRLSVFPLDKISNYIFTLDEIVKRFSIFEPYYPLWIDVYVKEKDIIELRTSLRFRKPSVLLQRGTKNAPFKFVEQ